MAYGTDSVPSCDKLFGPGNAWVTEAKLQVSADPDGAAIDMPAGPSEVLVIADAGANPVFVAADLLSQAEHGPDSQVILLSPSARLLDQVAARSRAAVRAVCRAARSPAQALAHSRLIRGRIAGAGGRSQQSLCARTPDPAHRRAARTARWHRQRRFDLPRRSGRRNRSATTAAAATMYCRPMATRAAAAACRWPVSRSRSPCRKSPPTACATSARARRRWRRPNNWRRIARAVTLRLAALEAVA